MCIDYGVCRLTLRTFFLGCMVLPMAGFMQPCSNLSTTFELLELCLGDVHEGVKELFPSRTALRTQVIAEGAAKVFEDDPKNQLELLSEDSSRMVISGDLQVDGWSG